MEDEDADLIAAKLASIQEAQAAGIPILEDLDEEMAQIEAQEQLEAAIAAGDDIPAPPPAPAGKKAAAKKASGTAPKLVVPVWKDFVYVEFSFATAEAKEGVTIAVDYNNYADGVSMQRIGDKYYRTLALGCDKTFKYKVRSLLLGNPLFTFLIPSCTSFELFRTRKTHTDAHSLTFQFFSPLPKRFLHARAFLCTPLPPRICDRTCISTLCAILRPHSRL